MCKESLNANFRFPRNYIKIKKRLRSYGVVTCDIAVLQWRGGLLDQVDQPEEIDWSGGGLQWEYLP